MRAYGRRRPNHPRSSCSRKTRRCWWWLCTAGESSGRWRTRTTTGPTTRLRPWLSLTSRTYLTNCLTEFYISWDQRLDIYTAKCFDDQDRPADSFIYMGNIWYALHMYQFGPQINLMYWYRDTCVWNIYICVYMYLCSVHYFYVDIYMLCILGWNSHCHCCWLVSDYIRDHALEIDLGTLVFTC